MAFRGRRSRLSASREHEEAQDILLRQFREQEDSSLGQASTVDEAELIRRQKVQEEYKRNMRNLFASTFLLAVTVFLYLAFYQQTTFIDIIIEQQPHVPVTQPPSSSPPPPSHSGNFDNGLEFGLPNDTMAYADPYWLANVKHQGKAAFNPNPNGYQGDGVTDDTNAINAAISSGVRCGQGCDSSTTSPALVYFPPGTYLVSSPIIAYYYTQLVGSPVSPPVLKASPGFQGIAVIDSDPYLPGGANWAVRNFVIDVTAMPPSSGTGIHWQVAQATSLYNIVFNMRTDPGNSQQGSGGFMSSLTFNGGKFGAFFGNQQFTTTNLVFNNCQTAIYMNWNWVWLLQGVKINNCGIGIDLSGGAPNSLRVGSVVLLDAQITNTNQAVISGKSSTSQPPAANTLVLDNVKLNNVKTAVSDPNGVVLLAGTPASSTIKLWGQGKGYSTGYTSGSDFNRVAGNGGNLQKPGVLLDGNGNFLLRKQPQYENYPASSFISVKNNGAVGDGRTDDTAALQAVLNKYSGQTDPSTRKIIFFDHGTYMVSSTLYVKPNTFIVGECWSSIMSYGSFFANYNNPQPVFKVGNPGDVGLVEISEMLFETRGPAGGAIVVQWSLRDPDNHAPGIVSGMWNSHVRIGGSAGTNLQSDQFSKTPNVANNPSLSNTGPQSAFLLMYITKTASFYLENSWAWTSDHELDRADHNQITIYSARGIYCNARGPVWLYGTGSEHNVMYQYQFFNAHNVFIGIAQTETPYYQSNPTALAPYPRISAWNDPNFTERCGGNKLCQKAWGLRILESSDIFVYGAGLYSFFENYSTDCIASRSCQQTMTSLERGSNRVWLFALTSIGTQNIASITAGGNNVNVPSGGNTNTFGDTVALVYVP